MAAVGRVVGAGALVVLLAAGAYGTADAYDVVPGVLTLDAPADPPAPFPTAPGAVPAPPVVEPLGPLDPAVPMPSSAQVGALVSALVADPRLGPTVGVVVADQLSGEVLASHLPDAGRIPASTAKLVTAVAALDRLGPDVTLPTRVVRGSGSDVVLVGGGDMLLAAGDGDPDAVVGHAGLEDLARQVARALTLAGTTEVRVRLDDTLFSGPRLSPTWKPSDIAAGYVAAVAPIGVDVGKIKPGEYPPRYPDPALQAAKQFAAALSDAGITVDGDPTRGEAPDGAPELGVVQSAPLGEVVHYFLSTSDNTITEVVARLVAVDANLPGSFEGATQAVLAHVRSMGVDTAGAHLADASGLGTGSTLSPTLLLELLRLATDPAEPVLREVATGMPIGGLSGTLSDRYTRSTARGMVRAKTGSLPSVTALAGSVQDADGRVLLFAVLADQTPRGQLVPRSLIDGFVGQLAACGCR